MQYIESMLSLKLGMILSTKYWLPTIMHELNQLLSKARFPHTHTDAAQCWWVCARPQCSQQRDSVQGAEGRRA